MYIKYEEKRVNPPQRSRIDLEGGWVKVEVRLHYILCAATRRVMFLPPSLRLTFLIELPLATFVVTAALPTHVHRYTFTR